MSYSSLLEAFSSLNLRKRDMADGLSGDQYASWRHMRNRLEEALFQRQTNLQSDRRQYLRVPVSYVVRYWTANEFQDRYLMELGEGGGFIASEDPLVQGTQLHLNILLGGQTFSVSVKGRVAWTRCLGEPYRRGMGIEFVNLNHDQKVVLYNLANDCLHERLLERRRMARIDTRVPVSFQYPIGSVQLHSEDISPHGVFVNTEHLLVPGEETEIRIDLPGHPESMEIRARVVRAAGVGGEKLPTGVGMRFSSLQPANRLRILDFMQNVLIQAKLATGSFPEQRRSCRLKRRIPMRYKMEDREGTTLCRDVSASGVFVPTFEPVPEGESVQVTLYHPLTQQSLELGGQVARWVEPQTIFPRTVPGIGVAFQDLNPDQDLSLREMLRAFLLAESGEPSNGLDITPWS